MALSRRLQAAKFIYFYYSFLSPATALFISDVRENISLWAASFCEALSALNPDIEEAKS